MNTARPTKLPLFAFALACEALESSVTAHFERAQKLAADGNSDEAKRALEAADAAANKLEALIESQLAATGEARPSTTKLDATLAA